MKRTPFFDEHVALGAKMVNFSGWEMPLHYGSQLQEHHTVRKQCGLFDVSHMGVIDLVGARVDLLLQFLLSNDVARIPNPGQGQYSLMLNIRAGISDDLIVYRMSPERYFLVVNAETCKKAIAWLRVHAPSYDVEVEERQDLALLALQGPEAVKQIALCLSNSVGSQQNLVERVVNLKPFHFLEDDGWRIARTGYTGEDGFELIVPVETGIMLWNCLVRTGVAPIGLGARDTLRLEAGMNLYGRDIDGNTSPLESGLGWVVAWLPQDRDFVGRKALQPLREQKGLRKRIGLILKGPGVLRDHLRVLQDDQVVGEISSGSYSPTLEKGIALARVARSVAIGSLCQVEVRGRQLPAQVVRPPFVRLGKPVFRVV